MTNAALVISDDIASLHVSGKVLGALRRAGYTRISTLWDMTMGDLLRTQGLGPCGASELYRELRRMFIQGTLSRLLALRDEEEEP